MKALTICQLAGVPRHRAQRTRPRSTTSCSWPRPTKRQGSRVRHAWLLAHRPDVFEGVRVRHHRGRHHRDDDRADDLLRHRGRRQAAGRAHASTATTREALQQGAHRARAVHVLRASPSASCPRCGDFFRDLAPTRIAFKPLPRRHRRTIARRRVLAASGAVSRSHAELAVGHRAGAQPATAGR